MATAQNPGPQSGSGAFGSVPGAIALPDPYSDLAARFPNLAGANAGVSSSILSKLNGTLSSATQNALQNAGAAFGVRSGMPGSDLSWNSVYGNIAGASEAQQQQGIQDYNSVLPTISRTQTVSPELQTEIATQNAVDAAAPNPAAAANYAQQLYDSYLNKMKGPGGGTISAGLPNLGAGKGFTVPDSQSITYNPGSIGSKMPGDPVTGNGGGGAPFTGDWGSSLDPWSNPAGEFDPSQYPYAPDVPSGGSDYAYA